ncbi:MAG: hypothetical protein AB8H86_19325 [Polyangiales bacterium]
MMVTIGREQEKQALDEAFSTSQIVTLCGAPGIGKSHLARAWLASQPHVALTLDTRGELEALHNALREELGLALGGGDLGRALKALPSPLVLIDSFEGATPEALKQVSAWSKLGVRFLVTSRRRLDFTGPAIHLGPLPTDGDESASVDLLLTRAAEFRHGFRVKTDAALLGDIVRHLDGSPLALELAAPRLVLLGPVRLLDHLRTRPNALGDSGALRSAVESSWSLLSADEQQVLTQATVFRGGFDLEAAEAVLEFGADSAVDCLQHLFEHSLLKAEEGGRFSLSWSVRECIQALTDVDAETQVRFAEYFAGVGAATSPEVRGADAKRAWSELQRERRNIWRAAEVGEAATRLVACAALGPLVLARGPLREFVSLVESQAKPKTPSDAWIRAQLFRAEALALYGDTVGAQAAIDELENAPPEERARLMAKLALLRGELDAAIRCTDAGLTEQSGGTLGPLLMVRAAALGPSGRLDDCRDALERALAEFRRLGEMREEGMALAYLGNVFADLDRMDDATFSLAQAQAIHEEVGDVFGIAFSEANFGLIAHKQARFADAIAHYDDALRTFRKLGARWYEGGFLGYRAMAQHQNGAESAESLKGLRHARELLAGDDRFYGYFTSYMAVIAIHEGALEQARSLLREADERIAASGDTVFSSIVRFHRSLLVRAEHSGAEEHAEVAELEAEALRCRLVDVCAAIHPTLRPAAQKSTPGGQVQVATDGSSFTTSLGVVVDLSERDLLKRTLCALADAHRNSAGVAVPRDDLIAAVWPGERMVSGAAANRLRVAIASLRKLGLRDVIVTRGSAYLLDLR